MVHECPGERALVGLLLTGSLSGTGHCYVICSGTLNEDDHPHSVLNISNPHRHKSTWDYVGGNWVHTFDEPSETSFIAPVGLGLDSLLRTGDSLPYLQERIKKNAKQGQLRLWMYNAARPYLTGSSLMYGHETDWATLAEALLRLPDCGQFTHWANWVNGIFIAVVSNK
jgi:hypothetical protein